MPHRRGGAELRDGEVFPGCPAGRAPQGGPDSGAERGAPGFPGPGGCRGGGRGEGEGLRRAAVQPGPAHCGTAPGRPLRVHGPGV